MEELDSLIATFSDSDSDSDDPTIPRRTVDDILNSPSTSPPRRGPQTLTHSNPPRPPISSSASLPSSTSRPSSLSSSSLFGNLRSNPRKPGAALAAAAAASRSVPTPHAAAIRFRRGSGSSELGEISRVSVESDVVSDDVAGNFEVRNGGVLDDCDIEKAMLVEGSGISAELDVPSVGSGGSVGNLGMLSDGNGGVVEKIEHGGVEGDELPEKSNLPLDSSVADESVVSRISSVEDSHELVENSSISSSNDGRDGEVLVRSSSLQPNEGSSLNGSLVAVEDKVGNKDNSQVGEESAAQLDESLLISNDEDDLPVKLPAQSSHSAETENAEEPVSEGRSKLEFQGNDVPQSMSCDGEADLLEGAISNSSGAEPVDEEIGQSGSNGKTTSQEAEKKSMKPLDWAEELEKRQASSGLDWEEGAVAQPMRLEGIRRGPPAVGYLQIDPDNAVTRAISSPLFRADHGSPQVVAVHMNFIAIGMSKGVILVMPSKYSPHSADIMEPKMLMLGSEGERSQSPVTSMCFNQQGDLLLAGYRDGHLTIWDMQKAAVAKVITGEHSAPVVHISFLGQDSQLTRQFRAVTGDSKGLVLLHAISVVPLFFRFSIKTQCLLDGKRTGTVLSVSPLLLDGFFLGGIASSQGNQSTVPIGFGSMMGGVVGGVVGGETLRKAFSEGSLAVEEGVVVFVTHQNALVVRLGSNVEFYKNLSKPEGVREGCIPYTAWKWVPFSVGSTKEIGPPSASDSVSWLVIVWDKKVLVYKLIKSDLINHKEWNLDSEAIGVAWLDDQMLVFLTVRGQLCLFTRDGVEIHQTNFVMVGADRDDIITYQSHFSNSLGNPEKAYHNSVAVRGATIYILGMTHLLVSRLLPWKERIQVLQKAGDWMGALDMSMRLYDGHAHGVVDLPRTTEAIRETIMPYLVELVLSYVDEVFSYISVAFSSQIDDQVDAQSSRSVSVLAEREEQFARVGGVAVEFCLHIKRTDILFDIIFSKFVDVKHGGTFLEILEPYILKDMLGSLPPEIMQSLVEHYNSKGWLQRVEQCVLHMDISSLDFNQVVKLCREHGLYGALIYLFNQGLDDYRTPLEELLLVVQNLQKEYAIIIGYRMLVYLKYCFLGLAFPPGHGNISLPRLPSLREELLQFLLEDATALKSQVIRRFRSSCEACPNLFYMLWLDVEATLEVLRCAFVGDAPTISEELQENGNTEMEKESETNNEHPGNENMAQNVVNSLVFCFNMESDKIRYFEMEDGGSIEVWPSEKDISCVLEFIAFFVVSKQATISEKALKHILEYLVSEDTPPTERNIKARQKEKQLLSLLGVVPVREWSTTFVLDLCIRAQYYQACGLIYTIRNQYLDALESYMKDMDEPAHAFAFIHKMLSKLEKMDYTTFRMSVISRLPELLKLSREGTFFLVVDHFSEENQHILSELQTSPHSLFLFLKTTIDIHLRGVLDFSTLKKCQNPNTLYGRAVASEPSDLQVFLDRLADFPKLLQHNPIHVTDEVTELYLELLCRYERGSVLQFLETFENYRLEHCLQLCQDYGITDAAAFLLERAGDVGSAFTLVITGLQEKIAILSSAVCENILKVTLRRMPDVEQLNIVKRLDEFVVVHDVLHSSIGLCQRNTQRLNPQESESLWLRLLDIFCEPLRGLYRDKNLSHHKSHYPSSRETLNTQKNREFDKVNGVLRKVFSELISEIVDGMIGYMPLPLIMGKLLADNGSQEFGDFKLAILGMLATYGFERKILDTAKSLIEDDTFHTMSLLKKGASHAYAPQSFACCICGGLLTKESSASGIRVFNCGHATHLHCDSVENELSERLWSACCPVCMPKRKVVNDRQKSVLVDNSLVRNSTSSRKLTPQAATDIHYVHEPEQLMERTHGLHHVSRFEILNNLRGPRKSTIVDGYPQLRLAPPAIYHEKVQKGAGVLLGESSLSSVKTESSNKNIQQTQPKNRGFSKRFPLKSSIFGTDKNRTSLRTVLR